MFSIGDTVYAKSLNIKGIVNDINGKIINVYFEKFHTSIGMERKDLVIIEKTTNEKELLRTKESHKKSTNFSIDCDYNKLFSEESLSITNFIEKLNYYRNPWTNELKYKSVIKLLIQNDLLEYNPNNSAVPTQNGINNGIERKFAYIGNNEYRWVNYYDRFAQELVLKLIIDSQYDEEETVSISLEKEEKNKEEQEVVVVGNPFQAFYDDLLALRLAFKEGASKLYYVIPETTLYEIYLTMPTSLFELFKIHGLAENRIKKMGTQILEVVNKHIELKDYSKPEIERTLDEIGNIGAFWSKEEDERLIKEINEGLSLKEIGRRHQRTPSAIRLRIKRLNREM